MELLISLGSAAVIADRITSRLDCVALFSPVLSLDSIGRQLSRSHEFLSDCAKRRAARMRQ
jgi:hypothetical protein